MLKLKWDKWTDRRSIVTLNAPVAYGGGIPTNERSCFASDHGDSKNYQQNEIYKQITVISSVNS